MAGYYAHASTSPTTRIATRDITQAHGEQFRALMNYPDVLTPPLNARNRTARLSRTTPGGPHAHKETS